MLLNDFRFALRILGKQPGFSLIAILILGLGVGANTAIFSLVDAVLIKPLPFRDAGRLVLVWRRSRQFPKIAARPQDFLEWQAQARSFDAMIGMGTWLYNVSGAGEPAMIYGVRTGAGLFSCLGIRPILGRDFTAADDRPGSPNVAILTHEFWRRQFGGDPEVLGRSLYLNSAPYTVIGVLPPRFNLIWDQISIWIPLKVDPDERFGLYTLARLKPSATIAQANEEMRVIAARVAERVPETSRSETAKVVPLADYIVGDMGAALKIMLAAVGFVLLICCANVANLLLARASGRSREIALRSALGASRAALLRQLLAESAVLALGGGLLGFALGYVSTRLVGRLANDELPRLEEVGMDWRVLAFTFAIALFTVVLFGLLPARRLLGGDLNAGLRESGRSAMQASGSRFSRNMLVIGEMALSLILLIGATLLLRSFSAVHNGDRGFQRDHMFLFNLTFDTARFPKRSDMPPFFSALGEKLESIPGVEGWAANANLQFDRSNLISYRFLPEGFPPVPQDQQPFARADLVNTNYFKTMGIPILQGRSFDRREREESPPVTIISSALARRYFLGQNPIGKRIVVFTRDKGGLAYEIVGVAGDVRYPRLGPETSVEFYLPYVQMPWPFCFFIVHSHLDAASLASSLRSAFREVDRQQPISNLESMDDEVSLVTSREMLNSLLSSIFAAIALVLAAAGMYGVISYTTAQRTQEIAVRMALGAEPAQITKWILRQGLTLAGAGALIGLAGYFAVARLLRGLLYGISATDLPSIAACTLILGFVAACASYLPARRAVRIDPAAALRAD